MADDTTTNDSEQTAVESSAVTPVTSSQNALTVNGNLAAESDALVKQIVAEKDPEKRKDLTYIFNEYQTKKNIVQQDQLAELRGALIVQSMKRVKNNPDEISTETMVTLMKTVDSMLDTGKKKIDEANEEPPQLIQINNSEINVGAPVQAELPRESRSKITNFIDQYLKSQQQEAVIDATVQEQETDTDETEQLKENENDD